ncbi:MAG TPA: 2-hydroxyacyl-CoA dehydratase family protein, partial [Gammaproteobacteria bacterium]|nr:2-hydroxyacyl-CoA dehydratase family protein [Gammaproteobacteria bacterium]
MRTAIDELTAGFEEPFRALGRDAARDRDAVVISWPSVPIEIVRAAGLRPVFARGGGDATPAADGVLEPELFPRRLHALVEAALTGRLAHAAAIVLPRTSDPDYKGFLYLRELVRRGAVAALPPVLLFDLLHSSSGEVAEYDVARTRDLCDRLAGISGRHPSADDLRLAIRETNAARAAARRLDALRRSGPGLGGPQVGGPQLDGSRLGGPRLGGSEALPLLGAFWQVPPERYAALASEAADAIATRPPLEGPRVLLAGVPVDSRALHEALESRGAIVVAEMSPYGA